MRSKYALNVAQRCRASRLQIVSLHCQTENGHTQHINRSTPHNGSAYAPHPSKGGHVKATVSRQIVE